MSADSGLTGRALVAVRSNALTFPILAVLSLSATVAVARALGTADFAVYALAIAVKGAVGFLADLGTGAASQRAFAQLEARGQGLAARHLFSRLLLLRAAIAALAVAAAFVLQAPIGSALGLRADEELLVPVMMLLAGAELCAVLGIYVLWGLLKQTVLNRITLTQGVVQPVLVVTVALGGLGPAGVVGILAAVSTVRAVWLVRRASAGLATIPPGTPEDVLGSGSFGRTAVAAGLGKLATFVHSRPALSFPVLATAPRAAFSTFALAYDLIMQVQALIIAPTSGVVAPLFAKVASERERLRRIAGLAVRLTALAVVPVAATLALAGSAIGTVLYGRGYGDVGDYLAVLAPALGLELALAGPATSVLLAQDSTLSRYAWIRVATVVPVVLYPVVGFAHVIAVAAILAGARLASAVALVLAAQRHTGRFIEPAWVARMALTTGAGIAAALPVRLATEPGLVQLVAVPAALCGAFAAAAYCVGLVGDDERRLLRRFLRPAASSSPSIAA